MERFDPPGFLEDFNAEQKQAWSETVSAWFNRAKAGRPAANDGPRAQFFNPLTDPVEPGDVPDPPAAISWKAFPNNIQIGPGSQVQKYRLADSSRDVQDEYCEWSVTRDPITRKIVRVTFTCEAPEYWGKLAAWNPAKVLELYRTYVNPTVSEDDLFDADGQYISRNRFNTDTQNGAMHLIQAANTLGAEIELAAAATIRRQRNGQELTGAQELIRCSEYGDESRNSDPHIGQQVNAVARQKSDITLNNPVGLYIADFNPQGFQTPDGTDAKTFWKQVRGSEGYCVRAVFEVPADRGYGVGDIMINGRRINTGAQLAEFITMKLEGRITRKGISTAPIFEGCKGEGHAPQDMLMGEETVPAEELPSRRTTISRRSGS